MNNEIVGYKETKKIDFSRLRRIHHNMKSRCYNENFPRYKYYGGRGITICDEWKNSPEMFMFWAIENGYRDDLTIDRIDNNKGYSPENCRWVDFFIQNNNSTNNRYIEYDGKRMSLSDWARFIGIRKSTLVGRLRLGWEFSEAIKI